ncbi:MAG: ribosome biogenesis GTPase Der [Dehalococcoidia bacterium]
MTAEPPSRTPLIAIVGRPNVGKSALFNRIVGRRTAIVEDLPGTTRDRLYGEATWRDRTVRVVDTGGLEAESEGPFSPLVRRQIEQAIDEADVILFVVDARDGITAADLEIAEILRRVTKPLLMVANKADNPARVQDVLQFYELGLGEPLPVSAYHGAGVGDLLDAVIDLLPPAEDAIAAPETLRVAIIGRPNVGKSALMNAILGEERVIVSDIPGTTRDVIDTDISYRGHHLTLLDTAGIRRRGKIERGVERHSVGRAQTAVERADVALVLMDATEPGAAQDTHIIGLAADAHVGIILIVNKSDLLPPGAEARDELRRFLRQRTRFVPWAPILFISAKERQGLDAVLDEVIAVGEQRDRRVPTGELNQFVRRAIAAHQPPSVGGRRMKLLYATQAEVRPPTFVFFVNDASLLHFGYRRYLENKIREAFGFSGTAIRLIFKSRSEEQVESLGGGRATR